MNKRQRKKALKRAMRRAFDRMNDPEVAREIGWAGAEFIRAQLRRPSPIQGLFTPLPRPPFRRWRDAQGVVHLAVEAREQHAAGVYTNELYVACTANPGAGDLVDDEVATCVRCQTYESERVWER